MIKKNRNSIDYEVKEHLWKEGVLRDEKL